MPNSAWAGTGGSGSPGSASSEGCCGYREQQAQRVQAGCAQEEQESQYV